MATNPTAASAPLIPVLLLEPDQWRFRGMSTVLENGGGFEVVGERDHAKILTMESSPDDLEPRVSSISQRLLVEYGISIIPHVKDLFPGCGVLIHGEDESLDVTAQILAAGGSGFYSLSAPHHFLTRAVNLVADGKLWGPREAVALLASRALDRDHEPAPLQLNPSDDETLLELLHEGLSNKEIAFRLQIGEPSVRLRLNRLYERFGVTSRAQLIDATAESVEK